MKRWPTPDMRYFNIDEFDSPDEPGSGQYMDDTFLLMLDDARHMAGVPFVINSGYRTKEHNAKVGGRKNSAHLDGFAADIKCLKADSRTRCWIIESLLEAGFNRIGIGKNFIHVDNDPNKPANVIWTYY